MHLRTRTFGNRWTHGPAHALGLAFVVLFLWGCVELPEIPHFETDLYLPLGQERASGLDLIEDSDFIVGDSTGVEPLAFLVSGEIDTVRIDDVLDFDTPSGSFSASLERIDFPPPEDFDETFTVGEVIGFPFDSPPGSPVSGKIVVPPFELPVLSHELPAQEAFEWIRFGDGRIRFIVENNLPVPVGDGTAEVAIGVRVRDRLTSEVILQTEIRGRIDPGASTARTLFLEGVSARSLLDLEIYGRSEGSSTPVEIDFDQGIRILADFQEVEPDSVIAEVPAQNVTLADTLAFELDEDIAIYSGVVQSGSIPLHIENALPLAANGSLVFPGIQRAGQPLAIEIDLPAANGATPGTFDGALDLAGTVLEPTEGSGDPIESVRYSLQVVTEASPAPVQLGQRQTVTGTLAASPLSFESVEASAAGREITVPTASEEIDPPEALEDLDFAHANVTLRVESTAGIPAAARLQVSGTPEDGGSPITFPIEFDILGTNESNSGSVVTEHIITELDAPLLELIRSRPTRVDFEGQVLLDPSGSRGIIRRDDWLRAEYELAAPFELRFDGVEYESDVFEFDIGEDAQERIRDDVLSAQATGSVENHFPAAVAMRIEFASSEERLLTDPEVAVDTIELGAGEVDPKSGRVVAATNSGFDVSLSQNDVAFFARSRVYARFVFRFDGELDRPVLVTATDYAEALALLRFRVQVGDQF